MKGTACRYPSPWSKDKVSHPEAQQSPHFTSEYACLLVFFFERAVSRHTHKHTHTKKEKQYQRCGAQMCNPLPVIP